METAIGRPAVSVPYVALAMARKVFINLEGKRGSSSVPGRLDGSPCGTW